MGLIVSILGIPGTGKSTQSKLLVEKCGYKRLSMGAQIRQLPEDHPISIAIRTGDLAPSEWVMELADNFINQNKEDNIVFDGCPRKVIEAEHYYRQYGHLMKYVIVLDIKKSNAKKRLKSRSREFETSKTIKTRFKMSRQVDQVVDYYSQQKNIEIVRLDGSQSEEALFNQICQIVGCQP